MKNPALIALIIAPRFIAVVILASHTLLSPFYQRPCFWYLALNGPYKLFQLANPKPN
jgi:hypothetical protein